MMSADRTKARRAAVGRACRAAACALAAGLHAGCGRPPRPAARPDRRELVAKALRIARDEGALAGVVTLVEQAEPLAATHALGDLMNHFYWKRKDVGRALAFGLAGVEHGLASAAAAAERDPKLAEKLRAAAKAIAYNVASFTWPGWSEPGIQPTAFQRALGRQAAKLNLRLAYELVKGHLAVSRGLWMVGAWRLADGDRRGAAGAFEHAALHAASAGAEADRLLNLGYAALVRLLDAPHDASGRARLDEIKARLAGVKDGALFVKQLETGQRVFSAR